jgi:Zn-dependent protease with chaperone function
MTADWTTPVEVIGWTLLHFLWQGTFVALALAGCLLLVPHGWARVRYAAACIALVAMALAPASTAAALLSGAMTAAGASSALGLSPVAGWIGGAGGVGGRFDASATGLAGGAGTWLTWLVTAWALGVLVSTTRLAGGWWQARRLLTREAMEAEAAWTTIVGRLARQLEIRQPVRLLQSARVHVPLVVGSLRPVLLLPAAALSGLTPRQIEAILAHELAHIRRHDYLVNLLQSGVETVLFYHPAVWWVSHAIRVEREHCCDDLAVRTCGDPVLYARALTTLETLRGDRFRVAMAASSGSLLSRVRRVLGQRPPAPVASSGWVVGSVTVLMVAGAGGWVADPARWMMHVASTAQAIALTPGDLDGAPPAAASTGGAWRDVQPESNPPAAAQAPDAPAPRGGAAASTPAGAPEAETRVVDIERTIEAAVEEAMGALEGTLERMQDDPTLSARLEKSVRDSLREAERALREAQPALSALSSEAVRETMREAERALREAQPAMSAASSDEIREALREAERALRQAQPDIAAATSEAVREAMREVARNVHVVERELRHELEASRERQSSRSDEARLRVEARRQAVTAQRLQRRARALADQAARLGAEVSRLRDSSGKVLPPERVQALQELARQLEEQARALAREVPQPSPAPRAKPAPRRSPRLAPVAPAPPDTPAPPAPPSVEQPPAPPAPAPPPRPRSHADAPPLPPPPAHAPAPAPVAPVPAAPATSPAPPAPPLE